MIKKSKNVCEEEDCMTIEDYDKSESYDEKLHIFH